jgi:hypothetical protein
MSSRYNLWREIVCGCGVIMCDPCFPTKIGKKEENEEKKKKREGRKFCLIEEKKIYLSVHNSIIFLSMSPYRNKRR